MAYNENIPKATDLISNSQSQIQANFLAIDSVAAGFARNHIGLRNPTLGGLHKRVDFQAPLLDPVFSGFVSSLYPKGGNNELFYATSAGVVQITNAAMPIWKGGSIGGTGVATLSASNLTLPNGLQMSYGTANTDGAGNATVNFNFPNALFTATLTRVEGGTNRGFVQWLTTPSKTSGTVKMRDSNGSSIAGQFYWFAVGN